MLALAPRLDLIGAALASNSRLWLLVERVRFLRGFGGEAAVARLGGDWGVLRLLVERADLCVGIIVTDDTSPLTRRASRGKRWDLSMPWHYCLRIHGEDGCQSVCYGFGLQFAC